MLTASNVYAWDNICETAKETPSMTTVKLEEFFKYNLEDRSFSGKGRVRDLRKWGSQYMLTVDCLNNVLVNVFTSSNYEELKVGQTVSFSGRCKRSYRRAYSDTKATYMLFDLEDGSVR